MTRAEFDEICAAVCPNCRKGVAARYRPDTNEWVHDVVKVTSHQHMLCWADGFRKSRFSKEFTSG